jgi:hypothetical protein
MITAIDSGRGVLRAAMMMAVAKGMGEESVEGIVDNNDY